MYIILDLVSEVVIQTSVNELLVFYLYFANSKGIRPAFMRILSFIDFYNQRYSSTVHDI